MAKDTGREINYDDLAVIDALDMVAEGVNAERALTGKGPIPAPDLAAARNETRDLHWLEEMDIKKGTRARTAGEQHERDSARAGLQTARRARAESTDLLNLPDVDEVSIDRLSTRKPEAVGYEMDQRFLVHINRAFLRDRHIKERGPLSLDEALELLRQKHPEWAEVLRLRTTCDLKQREVAVQLSIAQRTVSKYEHRAYSFLSEHCRIPIDPLAVADGLDPEQEMEAS